MQRALDAGAVVAGELPDAGDDVVQVLLADLALAEDHLSFGVAGLRLAAQVQLVRPREPRRVAVRRAQHR